MFVYNKLADKSMGTTQKKMIQSSSNIPKHKFEESPNLSFDNLRVRYNLHKTIQMRELIYNRTNKEPVNTVIQMYPWHVGTTLKSGKKISGVDLSKKGIADSSTDSSFNRYKRSKKIEGIDKIDCITKTAEFVSGLGVPAHGEYNKLNGKVDNSKCNPFKVSVESKYEIDREIKKLNLVYEFSNSSYAYIVEIIDNGKSMTMCPDRGQEAVLTDNEYKSAHDTESADDLISKKAYLVDAIGMDAITKLGGEGSRWKCVRNHTRNLKNTSKFYCSEGDKVYYIIFEKLWGKWKDWFGYKFNIEDSVVVTQIKNHISDAIEVDTGVAAWTFTEVDYDLQLHRANWIVNTFLDNFFKVIKPVFFWSQIPQGRMDSMVIEPVYIIRQFVL